MTRKKKLNVVNFLILFIVVILLRILTTELTNYWLTPKVGHSYSSFQKILVNDADGNIYEQGEYNQVKVYSYNNDSVFYVITVHNGAIYNDSSASTIADFSKLYH